MGKTKTNDERADFLKGLGLKAHGDSLVDLDQPAKVRPSPHVQAPAADDIVLAPKGLDPRSMPVEEIIFDPRLLDPYPSLAFDQGGNAASQYIFSLYKSYGRNKDRNGALQRKITSFITHTRRQRETGGMVKEKVKASKKDRDLAALIASNDGDVAEVAGGLKLLQAAQAAGVSIDEVLAMLAKEGKR